MELNLRKARKLEKSIETHLRKNALKTTIKLRIQSTAAEIEKALLAGENDFTDTAISRQNLVAARFMLRGQIAKANESTGINALIHQKAYSESLLNEVEKVAEAQVSDLASACDLANAKKVAVNSGQLSLNYDAGEALVAEVPVAGARTRDKHISEVTRLKNEIERLDDELSQKNIGVKITLDLDTELLLKRATLL